MQIDTSHITTVLGLSLSVSEDGIGELFIVNVLMMAKLEREEGTQMYEKGKCHYRVRVPPWIKE